MDISSPWKIMGWYRSYGTFTRKCPRENEYPAAHHGWSCG
jgi:hypothetical protein